jgi:phosphopantothenoylcysteine decarboxylase/phosphopantothenate--cysteine ligase
MGYALAAECRARGADVLLVSGPVSLPAPAGVTLQKVTSAAEMYDACMQAFPTIDIFFMSAAVADYRVDQPANEKIKKKDESLPLNLVKTTDILQSIGKQKRKDQFLVGFALETTDARAYALGKLEAKNADLIVMNNLKDAGAGFGHDTNKITIFDRRGTELNFDVKSKSLVAADIINHLHSFMHA